MGSLHIHNFAGLSDVVIEENPHFNILIGPQASGKSVIAKLLYFFGGIISLSRISVPFGKSIDIHRIVLERFLLLFPKSNWPDDGFTISYVVSECRFMIQFRNGELSASLPEQFLSIVSLYEKDYKSARSKLDKPERGDDSSLTRFFAARSARQSYILRAKKLGFPINDQFFVVAGRSFYSELQDSIFEFSARDFGFDKVLMESFSLFSAAKRVYSSSIINPTKRTTDEVVRELMQKILHAEYKQEESKDILTHPDGRKVEIKNSSSGQQETFPLLMVLYYVYHLLSAPKLNSREGLCLFIEEPEAHIFPSSQKLIVELISYIFNRARSLKKDLRIVITTHSPYIMTSFNNLIEGDNVIREDEAKAADVDNIIGKNTHIPFEDICAYFVGDGMAHSLMDEEDRLINPSELDEVSSIIGKEFDQLLSL